MAKPGVMFYFEIRPCIKRLTLEEKGQLFEAILNYGEFGAIPKVDGAVGVAWDFIQQRLDRDTGRYDERVEQTKYAVAVREAKKKGIQLPPFEKWRPLSDEERERLLSDDAKLSDAMLRYAVNFPHFLKEGKGLLLFGPVGTGKSFYAACIANRVIEMGYSAKMTNFATLTNDLQGMNEGRNQYIEDLNRYGLLIIDDLGAERKSEYMQEMVFNIIDSRYRSGLPMVITTNLSGEEIKKPENTSYARIYDRLLGCCFPQEITGPSRRKKELRESFGDMRAMLGL